MVKDKEVDFEGDSLLFESEDSKYKGRKDSKDSDVDSKSKSNTEESDKKGKSPVEKVNKMTRNDEFVIRIRKPKKIFVERSIWSIVVLILLILVLKGSSCDINTNFLASNESSSVDEIEVVDNTDVEEDILEPEVIVEPEKTVQEMLDDLAPAATCTKDALDVKILSIVSTTNKLTKISVKISAGTDDIKGYQVYLGARVPEATNYINIIPTSNSQGAVVYTSTLAKCTTKTIEFTTFSPKYYSVDADTEFKVQFNDAAGKKLDLATKTHDFS